MGVVYAAEDASGREVALKAVPLRGATKRRERFEREREALGQLRHPNVIPVHTAGEADGFAYFAMPLVPGGSLSGRVEDGGPLGPAAAVELGLRLCDALGAAHELGVLHRDLKPENVLFGSQDEPLLADFGLARAMLDTEALTQSGAFLGTPGYMSPEQARGDREAQGAATDVYGLGATLYFALTGEPPLSGGSLPELLLNTERVKPARPSRLNPAVPRGLDAVVLRCLRKDGRQRFRTVAALRAALERSLEVRSSGRSWALGALLLGGGLVVGAWLWPADEPPAPAPASDAPPQLDPDPEPQQLPPSAPPAAVPRGDGPVPWERTGLPKLELEVGEALAEARKAKLAEDSGRAAMFLEYARRQGAGEGSERVGFELEYVAGLASRALDLWDHGWTGEAMMTAHRVAEVADPYWNPEERGLEEIALAGQFQVPYTTAHFLLCKDHLAAGRLELAREEYERVCFASPSSTRVHHLGVMLYLAAGEPERALKELEVCCLRAQRKDPARAHDPKYVFAYARDRIQAGGWEQARPYLEYVRDGYREDLHVVARHLLDREGQARARDLLAGFDPRTNDTERLREAGGAMWRLDHRGQANAVLTRAMRLDGDVRTCRLLAEMRLGFGWSDGEEYVAVARMREDPAERARGIAYEASFRAMAEDWSRAARLAARAVELEPRLLLETRLGYDYARCLLELGREEALGVLDALASAASAHRRAQAAHLRGDYATELEALKRR